MGTIKNENEARFHTLYALMMPNGRYIGKVIYLVQLRACCRNGGMFKCEEYAAMKFGNSEKTGRETARIFLRGSS